MFGADAAQVSMLESDGLRYETRQRDTFDYLFPKFTHQSPWQQTGQHRNKLLLEDFILIAEFSEQEGPRPVIVIPKDGGQNFDQNEFSVKILAVDHQSSIVEGVEMTEDAQVVMSDPDTDTHAFIHHIVLNDIQARGYVRPFCISYVTSDPLKIMKCYEEISSQMKKVARLMKYGNRLVFMRDLEKHQEDLSYTKAHLLLSQNRSQVSAQGDSDLLNALNTLRQCMEEVKDILSNLKPLLQVDAELSERFQFYERELRSHRHKGDIDSDSSSLKDFESKDDVHYTDCHLSGSLTDRTTEFSLFSKVKDQKPKILDVSTIRGKRRFDRSLRGLHELCSWGTKEGLQKLRAFREFLKRDLASIYVDELDMSALIPESGVLCFSNNTVGANFLSTSGSIKNSCCVKRKVSEVTFHHAGLTSLGSVESFKSLSSSFQSFYDDDTMYSANSSMVDTSVSSSALDRQISEISGAPESSDGGAEDLMFPNDNSFDTNNYLDLSAEDWNSSLLNTLKAGEVEFDSKGKAVVEQNSKSDSLANTHNAKEELPLKKDRSDTANSDFDNIDIDKDLKCTARGCACEKKIKSLPVDHSKCNIEQNGANIAVLETQCVLKDEIKEECNDNSEESKNNVFNTKKPNSLDLEANNGADDLTVMVEDVSEDNGDITPVMTESSSTHCDQFSVITDTDNPSAEKDKTNQEGNKLDDVNIVSELRVDNDVESKGNFKDKNKVDNVNVMESLLSGDKQPLEINSDQTEQDIGIVCESDMKENDVKQKTAKSIVSSDSGFDMENVHEKQTSLDFGSVSDRQSEIDFSENDRYSGSGFGHGHDRHGFSIHRDISQAIGTADKTLGMEAKKRKWKFMHPFKNLLDGDCSVGQSLQKVMGGYNNLQHIVYSLLSGRPVVVLGTRRQEVAVRELIQAMSMFVPYTPRSSSVGLLCQIKQLKMSDIHRFQLRGVIRSDKRSVDYMVPKSVRRYVTLIDLEKSIMYCQPYQGILLNFITSVHNKKKTFKSEAAILTYVQLCLQEISTKAFSFYHAVTSSNEDIDFSGASLPHRSSMLELTLEKYLNRAGIHNSDCRIIKYLTEIVKLQQIEEEFRSKYLTDAPAYPFSVTHQSIQTYRL
ncbi:uncharacterized protein LOC123551904 [Mercenaria mercenaria]|uniref:uncharacterized protein LOC123551904 n=1 Tax=Mercenaria mercenaria TaxID=6596 RepID=UPI00234F7170|nr:uncharacterized protein LOC123551904 [Mercenaria mercenaria]